MNFIVSIILILASVGVFFGYVDPNYKGTSSLDTNKNYTDYSIEELKTELATFKDVEQNSTSIVKTRKALVNKRDSIKAEDTDKLEKLLPSNIDNIRLIIELGKIAQVRNLSLRGVSIGNFNGNSSSVGETNTAYGTLSVSFGVTSTYNNFLNFLSDLENNLRIIDVTGISFASNDSGTYDFSVTLNTYWLK